MGFVVEMLLSEGLLVSEGSINDRRAGRRSIRHAAAAFAVILLPAISTGCNRWPPGTWRLDREGWEGRLVISGDVEVDVFGLQLTGPEGALTWRGTVYRAESGLRLDVHHVNGELVYPDRDFSKVLEREGDTLTGEILGARLTFRKRQD